MPALSDSTSGAADCGAGTQATITAGYQAASHTIYEGELASPEVTDDLRHVTSSNGLARGVADGDQAIVRAETHKIVYTHHWHIVRLHLLAQGAPIMVNGAKVVTFTYPVLAFPAGQVEVMLAIPAASAALEQASCAEVNAQTYGEISVHLAMLINVRNSPDTYVMLGHEFDPDKLTFVRSGSIQLAGSNGLPGPASIPDSGSVSYEGQVWLVYSFLAKHSIRVYILFPDTTAGGTGASGSTGAS